MLVALAVPAAAQAPPSEADVAFKNGRDLLKAGKFAEACREFEHSEQLDPQLGTRFNIAQCDEKIGKIASALAIFRDLAANDTNAKRKQTSSELVAQLSPRVPKLVVQVATAPPHLGVMLSAANGSTRPIHANEPVELDFGDYTVVVHGDGVVDFTGKVAVREESRTTTLAVALVPAPAPAEPAPTQPVAPREAPPDEGGGEPAAPPHSRRKLFAVGALAVGGAAVAGGVVAGVLASGKWSDAKKACDGGTTCATPDELAAANALRSQATSRANISTGLVVGGAVFAAAGVALWLTAPSEHAVALAPTASAHSAALVLSARF
ncbi:MAG TPA: hypothetical protein VMJ10_19665 [Kofleriaceae bacterium]|nr:hypothetical protein [Kofleriaceae bacterium]